MKQEIMVHVPRKRCAYPAVISTDTLVSEIGKMVEYTTDSQYFELAGCKVVIPGRNNTTDDRKRSYLAMRGLTVAVFGQADAEQVFEDGTPQFELFKALSARGISGSVASKAAIVKAIDIWLRSKTSEIKKQEAETVKLHAAKMHRIETNLRAIRTAKAETKGLIEALVKSEATAISNG